MKRIALITSALALLAATPAQAGYFLSQRGAEHFTRVYWHNERGYHYTGASCRPQGARAPERGYIYHRWACGFAVGDSSSSIDCSGLMLITGSSTGGYYSRVDWKRGDCSY